MVLSTLRNTTITVLLVVGSVQAYSPSAKNNVALYWGGRTAPRLAQLCKNDAVDIVILSFMDQFPGQSDSGMPGTNFAGNCNSAHYPGSRLLQPCAPMPEDIKTCQSLGKKVILALGGQGGYQLSGDAAGEKFADWLWGAFGPQSANNGQPRPIESSEVDGFDFDIELRSPDNQEGYIAMINRLRSHYAAQSKEYLITGAPQCVVPDANMGEMMTKTEFDMLFVQFYNTPECSARRFVDSGEGFTYDELLGSLAGTPSANAKIYLGLQANEASGNILHYLTDSEVERLVQANANKPNFGGIMIWDAASADSNRRHGGRPYYQVAKDALNKFAGGSAPVRKVGQAISSKENAVATSSTKKPSWSSPRTTSKLATPLIEAGSASIPTSPTRSAGAETPSGPHIDPVFFKTFLERPSAAATTSMTTPSVKVCPTSQPCTSTSSPIYLVPRLNLTWPVLPTGGNSAQNSPLTPCNTTLSVSQNLTIRTSATATPTNELATKDNKSSTSKRRPAAAVVALGALAIGAYFLA